MRKVNANYGIVRSVSADRTKIKVVTPRGGTFECRNEGFEIGQPVCFILDALNQQVIRVLPKDVADMWAFMGSYPELQDALMEEPEDSDCIILDYDPELMEVFHDNDIAGEGRSVEEYLDFLCEATRNDAEGWESDDWPGDQE